MNFHPFVRKAAAAAFVAFSASSALAATVVPTPAAWSFSQSYGANGSITGVFVGSDLNGDGLITYFDSPLNELLSLTLSISSPAFTASFGPGKIVVGGVDTSISEFQYVIGSTSMDAIKPPGGLANMSVVTLFTPVIPGLQPADAYLIWTAGSATFDPAGVEKGYATIMDTQALTLGDYVSTQAVQVQPTQLPAVPEPATWLFMASGLALLSLSSRRRQSNC